jgi:hypothetical protein
MKIMADKRPRPATVTEKELAERCARSLQVRSQALVAKEIAKLERENEKLRQAADKVSS